MAQSTLNTPPLPADAPIIRSISGIVPDICISEEHRDELVITDSPVEGSVMTDHAYKAPAEVEITCAWSPSGPLNSGKSPTFLNDLYAQILGIQYPPMLFTVYTARRIYRSCLMAGVAVTTDKETENALVVRFRIRQLQVTTTQTLQVSATQANPSQSLGISQQGIQQLQPNPPTFDAGDFANITDGS